MAGNGCKNVLRLDMSSRPLVDLFSSRWLQVNMDNNFKFPLAFASKRKKLEAFNGLPKFSWDEITSQEVIGQGSFGAVFITQYQTTKKPSETVVVKKLLGTASDFTETFVPILEIPPFRDSPF